MAYEQVGDATLYRVEVGRLFSSTDIQNLRNDLQGVVERSGRPLLAIDFSALQFISSRGLGVLVAIHKLVQSKQGTLVLFAATEAIRHVLNTTKLDSILPVVTDRAAALDALRKGPT